MSRSSWSQARHECLLCRLSRFVKLRRAVEAHNWEEAAQEMENSRWFRQVGARARELVTRMRSIRG